MQIKQFFILVCFGANIKFYFDQQLQISLLEDFLLFQLPWQQPTKPPWLQQIFKFKSVVLLLYKIYSFKVNTDILGFSYVIDLNPSLPPDIQ